MNFTTPSEQAHWEKNLRPQAVANFVRQIKLVADIAAAAGCTMEVAALVWLAASVDDAGNQIASCIAEKEI